MGELLSEEKNSGNYGNLFPDVYPIYLIFNGGYAVLNTLCSLIDRLII